MPIEANIDIQLATMMDREGLRKRTRWRDARAGSAVGARDALRVYAAFCG